MRGLVTHSTTSSAAIRAVTRLSSDQTVQFERLAARFGFEPVPESDTLSGRLRGLGQNVMGLLLVVASNPRGAHLDLLFRPGSPFFISRRKLEERYREGLKPPSSGSLS